MDDVAIRAEGLSKRYRLGKAVIQRTLREQLVHLAGAPFRRRDPADATSFVWALKDVSFEIKRGDVVGIVGRNGAGKSTLLKILSRITEPTEGSVDVFGRVGSLLEVGTGFHEELTGRENVYLSGAIMGMRRSEIKNRFDEIVAFAEVGRFIDTQVKFYSSGMYLRLAFAVAAHLEPEILIVDEVLAVGDAAFQQKCLGKMGDVSRSGRTVLLVSHNMAAVQRLCGVSILVDGGRIKRTGDTHAVVQEYLAVGGPDAGGTRSWEKPDQPGDEIVRLRAVRSVGSDGTPRGSVDVHSPIQLEVEFEVLTPGQFVNVNIYVYDTMGNLLFMVGDWQTDRWQREHRPLGVHKSRCTVPADLLNECTLRLLVALVTPPSTMRACVEQALFVSIVDDHTPRGGRGFYPAAWPPAAVRPLLKWEYEHQP
jgi:lipopolysaccharide transport system ATP-binding protein